MKAKALLAIILLPLLAAADYQLDFFPNRSNVTRLKKENGRLILTPGVKKSLGGAVAEIKPRNSQPLLFEADVECVPLGAFIQIVTFKNNKVLLRTNSHRNKKTRDHLKFYFDPTGADKVQVLLRCVFDEQPFAKRAVFSNIRLTTAEQYVADKEPVLSLSPGYNVCSVYLSDLQSSVNTEFSGRVQVRGKGEKIFKDAPPLIFDHVRREARSIIPGLKSAGEYEVQLSFTDRGKTSSRTAYFKTKPETIPIAGTILVDAGKPLVITESGTPSGYIRYTAPPGTVLNFGKNCTNAISLRNAKYILLENMTIRGGKRNAIHLWNCDDIAIINCDISGFGEKGVQQVDRSDRFNGKYFSDGKFLNNDSGICIEYSNSIRVERCFIHDPAGTSNSWFYCHPAGPDAVFVRDTRALALRNNDFTGSDQHRWNDAVISAHNFIECGGSYQDAEISGNTFAFGNDDSMELDGGQINAAYFGNYITDFLCGVSAAPCLAGPSYIFDNLFDDGGEEYGAISAAVKNNSSLVGRGQVNIFGNIIRGNWKFGINPFGGKPFEKEILKKQNITSCLIRNNVCQLTSGTPVNPAAYRVKTDSQNTAISGISDTVPSKEHPVRNLPFSADKRKIHFSVSSEGKAQKQTITLHALDGFSGEAVIRCTNDAPYTVSPQRLSFASSKSIQLTIAPQPEKIALPRISRTIFLVQLKNGLSMPFHVSVDATDRPEQIAALRKDSIKGKIVRNGKVSAITFNVDKAGIYHHFCRISPKSAVTVKVSADDRKNTECSFYIPSGVTNPWCHLGGRVWRGGVTYPHRLTPGTHTFIIEGDAEITSSILTQNPDAYRLAPEQ